MGLLFSLALAVVVSVDSNFDKIFGLGVVGKSVLVFSLALAGWVGLNLLFRFSASGLPMALGIAVMLLSLGAAGGIAREIRAPWFRWGLLALFLTRLVFELYLLLASGSDNYYGSLPVFFALASPLCFLLILRLFGAPSWLVLLGFLPYFFFLTVQWRSIALLFGLLIVLFAGARWQVRNGLKAKAVVLVGLVSSYALVMGRPLFFIDAQTNLPASWAFLFASNPDGTGFTPNLSSRTYLWNPLFENLSRSSVLDILIGTGPGQARGLVGRTTTVHNDYLQILVDFGVVGLLLVLTVLGLAILGLNSGGGGGRNNLVLRLLAVALFVGQGNIENVLEMASIAFLISLHMGVHLESELSSSPKLGFMRQLAARHRIMRSRVSLSKKLLIQHDD